MSGTASQMLRFCEAQSGKVRSPWLPPVARFWRSARSRSNCTTRPVVEPQAAYIAALAQALRTARANGTRVVVRPVVVETVVRR